MRFSVSVTFLAFYATECGVSRKMGGRALKEVAVRAPEVVTLLALAKAGSVPLRRAAKALSEVRAKLGFPAAPRTVSAHVRVALELGLVEVAVENGEVVYRLSEKGCKLLESLFAKG